MLLVFLAMACKKETVIQKNTYILQEFNPPLSVGWVDYLNTPGCEGPFAICDDTTFILDFDLDTNGMPDVRFQVTEGMFTSWLPYIKTEMHALGAGLLKMDEADFGDTANESSLAQAYSGGILAYNHPGRLDFHDESDFYIAFRLKVNGRWHYGWMQMYITGFFTNVWRERAIIWIERTYISLEVDKPIRVGFVEN